MWIPDSIAVSSTASNDCHEALIRGPFSTIHLFKSVPAASYIRDSNQLNPLGQVSTGIGLGGVPIMNHGLVSANCDIPFGAWQEAASCPIGNEINLSINPGRLWGLDIALLVAGRNSRIKVRV
jgi:hypothetical protein